MESSVPISFTQCIFFLLTIDADGVLRTIRIENTERLPEMEQT
jgi:hypothetical protein